MTDFSSYTDVGSQNFLILIAIVVGATALAFFILPLLMKSRNFRVSISISLKKVKQNPVISAVVVFLVVVIFGGGYLFYLQGRPQIVSAGQLNSAESENLDYIQGGNIDYDIIKNSDMFVLDVRTEEEYTKEHIKGSFSAPLEKVRNGFTVPNDRKIAVYSSQESFDEARAAADILKAQVDVKVYVIEGGYEGLKEQGLETVKGAPFGDG